MSNQSEGTMHHGYHQDGLLDIFLALGILFATVALSAGLFWLVAILPVFFYLAWGSIKRSITAPRVEKSASTSTYPGKGRLVFSVLIILGVISFVLGMVIFWMFAKDLTPLALREWVGLNFVLVSWVFGGFLLGLIALLAHLPRYYFYALLALVAGTGGPHLGFQPVLYVVGLAALMMVVGVLTLLHFFSTHPK